jgi:hypothetical protein
MLPGVQRGQRVQRVWGNQPSHSQVNSHCASWSPKWTLESSNRNFKGQNPSIWRVFYIIEKLLKLRCLKWACITHLDIWNTSYDQKKGHGSNWQFDSRPLKVKKRFDFLACRQRATYCWKAFNKGYNFSSDLIVSEVYTRNYAPPKLQESQLWEFWDSHSEVLGQNAIWMWPPWKVAENIIRGEVVASPKFGPWWILWVRGCLWLVLEPKVPKLCTNQPVVWFV